MQDNLSIIITMIIFVTLVVIFPLYNLFERQDDMSYTLALKVTTSFVDEVRNNGYIDQNAYNDFVIELGNTGNSYDIDIEAHRKTLIDDLTTTTVLDDYIEQYKIDYTEDILKVINTGTTNITGQLLKDNAYLLNEDDQIYVKLKNSTTTMAGAIFNAIIPTAKKDRIVVNYGGVVKNSSWSKVESTIHSFTTKPTAPVISVNGATVTGGTAIVEADANTSVSALASPSDWWKKITSYVWTIQYSNGTVENITTPSTGTDPYLIGTIIRSFSIIPNHKVSVYAVDNYGETSAATTITINTYSNGPSKPILASNPDTINTSVVIPVSVGTRIDYTASSTVTSSWKTITRYVWTVQNGGAAPYTTTTNTGNLSVVFNAGVSSVTVYAVDSAGMQSAATGTTFTINSTPPNKPVLSSNPDTINNNVIIPVAGGTRIDFTAISTVNNSWKTITSYVWTVQNGGAPAYTTTTATGNLSVLFNTGVASVTVYAVDSAGLASTTTGTAFSVMNNFAQQAISSVGLAEINSIIIAGATVSGYSFEVGVSPGHGGNDWWRIQGLTTGGVWESVSPGGAVNNANYVSNGVYTGQVTLSDPSRYVQLKFQYSVDTGHAGCLTSGSYIKYSVKYKF